MGIPEMAKYIVEHKNGKSQYAYGDNHTVVIHVRTVLYHHVHITDEHIYDSLANASTYEEFIELCRPLAIADTEEFERKQRMPPAKGRTKRRFR